MTEVLHFPSSPSTTTTTTTSTTSISSSSPASLSCATLHSNDASLIIATARPSSLSSSSVTDDGGGDSTVTEFDLEEFRERERQSRDQLSLLALLVTLFRKSLIACKSDRRELCAMEIGWPTEVRHVAHVTFDRFNGFLGLPVEFEPEVPRRAPSASTTVFGVSTESMQLSYDSRGNSVPTILLLMQRRLYARGGLQAEGIFRINAENSQEEYVRDQLNRGLVPEGVDVHCLAGLIKAWFRELPTGILDSLSPEQVMRCHTEEDCAELVRLLPPTEAFLLDWAINLMADVVQQEHLNKMNARNIAMVFAPNMTQMADPLTALMYAVQVMNFLKTLIIKTLRGREDSIIDPALASHLEPSDESGNQSPSLSCTAKKDDEETEQAFADKEPDFASSFDPNQCNNITDEEEDIGPVTTPEKLIALEDHCHETAARVDSVTQMDSLGVNYVNPGKVNIGQPSSSNFKWASKRTKTHQPVLRDMSGPVEKNKGISNLSCIDSRIERIEAWR